MKIKTNNVPRLLLDFDQLTDDEREDLNWFEPVNGGDFVRYRGTVYRVDEFTVAPEYLKPWEGMQSETYFSGVLVRYTDRDHVVMGTYIS
jgi:hypothetical protein